MHDLINKNHGVFHGMKLNLYADIILQSAHIDLFDKKCYGAHVKIEKLITLT